MFFAIADYIRYRARAGRFGREPAAGVMSGAFQGELSPQALALLRAGDVIFVQTLDRPISWAIMYLTSSEVSHMAFYLGDGRIGHATIAGVVIESVASLYGEGSRMLPCIWPMPDEKRKLIVETLESQLQGRPYGWAAVFLKATRILSARDWPYFRWKFYFDIAVLVGVLGLASFIVFGAAAWLWILPTYLAVVLFNAVLWRFLPLRFSEWTGKPVDVLRMLQAVGGSFVMDAYSLRQQSQVAAASSSTVQDVAPDA